MRRSYLLEYTVLLVICFFSVRACISEKQVNTDLKSENTAISDSTVLYKKKYGQERAARQAIQEEVQPEITDAEKFSGILELFRKQVPGKDASMKKMLTIKTDTFRLANREVVRFQYGNKWTCITGMLVFTHTVRDTTTQTRSGNMISVRSAAGDHLHSYLPQ